MRLCESGRDEEGQRDSSDSNNQCISHIFVLTEIYNQILQRLIII